MEVESSQIVHVRTQVDISELLDVEVPSEEELYRPLQRLVKELNLFDFLEQLDMDALLTRTGGPIGFRPYTLLREISETVPYIGFVTKEEDVSITVSPKRLTVDIELEEEEGEEDEDPKEPKGTKEQLIKQVSSNLKTLMSVLYSKQLLEEETSIEIPIRIINRYKLNVEETQALLSYFLDAISCDKSIGIMSIENVTIRVEKEPKKWTLLTISIRKDRGSLISDHSDILGSLKEIDIDSLIEMNIDQTNTIISTLGK